MAGISFPWHRRRRPVEDVLARQAGRYALELARKDAEITRLTHTIRMQARAIDGLKLIGRERAADRVNEAQ